MCFKGVSTQDSIHVPHRQNSRLAKALGCSSGEGSRVEGTEGHSGKGFTRHSQRSCSVCGPLAKPLPGHAGPGKSPQAQPPMCCDTEKASENN